MLDKIILGFLQLKSLTSYDLKKALDTSVNHFYSTSYGSIHPALIKMEEKGWISCKDISTGARKKKLFSITDSGKEAFHQWMGTEIPVTRIKEDALVRIFFFGLIPSGQRVQMIEDYIGKIQETLQLLKTLKQRVEAKEVPANFREIADYQMETLRFGIDSGIFTQTWFKEFINKERKK